MAKIEETLNFVFKDYREIRMSAGEGGSPEHQGRVKEGLDLMDREMTRVEQINAKKIEFCSFGESLEFIKEDSGNQLQKK